jgi:folate-binding protein YgfZ
MTAETYPIDRDLVVVHGPDATSFLQSLVSQDLDALAVGAGAHSLLLQPQGKLVVDFYVLHRAADEWWCMCEPGFGSLLAEGLNRFKIRVKAQIEQREITAVAVLGGAQPFQLTIDGDDTPTGDAAAYERARIEMGVPRMGADLDERVIPQEAFLDRDAVSFTKGCFVGQELVCRIDTRGHVNRYLRRLRGDGLVVGDEPTVDGKVVGQITSSVGDVALGYLRREVEAGSTVDVRGHPAVVEAI